MAMQELSLQAETVLRLTQNPSGNYCGGLRLGEINSSKKKFHGLIFSG